MGVTPTAGTPAAGTDNQQGSRALPTRGASIRGGSGTPRDRVRCSPCWVGVMALGMSPRRHPGAECPPTLFHFPSRSSLPLSPTTLLLLPSSPKAVQTPRGTFLTAALPGLGLGGPGQCHLHVPQGTPHLPIRTPQPGHGAPGRPLALPCPALPCLAAACSALGLPSSISKDTWVRGRAPRRFRELAELGKKPPRLFPSCSPPRHSRTSPRRWHAASPPRTRTSPGSAEQAGGAATGTPASGLHLWDLGWDEHPPAPGRASFGPGQVRGPGCAPLPACSWMLGAAGGPAVLAASSSPSPRKAMFLEENERKAGSARCANSVREPRNMKRPFVLRAIILPELAFCISVCKTSP